MRKIIVMVLGLLLFGCGEKVNIEQIVKDDKLNGEQKNFLEGCEKYDDAKACYEIAEAYNEEESSRSGYEEKRGNIIRNNDKALKYYEKSCDLVTKTLKSTPIQAWGNLYIYFSCREALNLYEKKEKAGIKGSADKVLYYKELVCLNTNSFNGKWDCNEMAEHYIKEKDYQKAKKYKLLYAMSWRWFDENIGAYINFIKEHKLIKR